MEGTAHEIYARAIAAGGIQRACGMRNFRGRPCTTDKSVFTSLRPSISTWSGPDAHRAREYADLVDLASGDPGICAGHRDSGPELWRRHRWHWCNERYAAGVPGDLR